MESTTLTSKIDSTRAGHSLLEMMFALGVFLTISVATLSVWIQHSKSIELASARLMAQHVGQAMMEDCIAAGFANVDSLAGVRPSVTLKQSARGADSQIKFDVRVLVRPEDPKRHWKVVEVVVEWRDSLGQSQVAMKTLLAKL